MPTRLFHPLERDTLRQRCLAALRSAITAGQFRPGEHLAEIGLSASFGISRATVREALRHLQQEGLVVAGPRGMLRVRQLDEAEIREIYGVRAALEALAAETLASVVTRAPAVAALAAAVDRLGRLEGDIEAQVEADLAFHQALCEQAGNRTLLATWRSIEGPIRVAIMHAGPSRALHNMAAARHRPIVDAIGSGDAALARRVLFEHMREAAERLLSARRPS